MKYFFEESDSMAERVIILETLTLSKTGEELLIKMFTHKSGEIIRLDDIGKETKEETKPVK